ncbi:hypothetical protein BofuT4_P065380.1 [Botrytis cinerea T4]|uniref:Uncharacterized protein n=1 Tax=Botryotinia fuckeliana (strain T4) TaxID=999810 RepID=G2XRY0_BOTF4|nr:hypothetical protein BofuT4_P065380.1 [Botrytis cinerea T4]
MEHNPIRKEWLGTLSIGMLPLADYIITHSFFQMPSPTVTIPMPFSLAYGPRCGRLFARVGKRYTHRFAAEMYGLRRC